MFGGEVEKIQSRQGRRGGPPRGGIPDWLRYAILAGCVLVLAVCIAGGIFALLFSRGDPVVSQRIVQLISDAVGSDSTRIESDRVHGSVFGGAILENPRLVVLTPDGPVVWLHATRLRAEYDTYQLLFSRRRSLRITIDSPVVPLVHDKHGNLVVPRFHGSKRNPLDKSATRIDVSFQNGTLSLDREDVRFGNIAGNALATLEPDRTTLRVTRISGKSLMPDRPANIRAEGIATVSGGHLRFDPLYAVLDHSRIRSAIDWDLEHARVVSSRTGLSPLEVSEVMRLLDLSPPAQGTLYGEVQFAGDPSSGNAVARLSGTLQGEPVDTLFVRATLVPGAIHVDDGRMRVRETEVQGRAVIETRGMITAEAKLKNVNPAQIPWWRVPANTPHGSLAGTARIRAVRAKPYPVADVSMDLDRGSLGRLQIERGFVHTRLGQRGDLSVDTAWVDTPGARLVASGTVSPDTTLAFTYEALVRDLGAMSPLLSPVSLKSGKGRVQGTLRGTSSAPDFLLQGVLTSGTFTNDMSFDSLRISSHGKLSSSTAAVADVAVAGLRAGDRPLGDVVSALTLNDKIVIDRYRESLGDTTLTLHGEVRFRGQATMAMLDSVGLAVGDRAWRNVQPVQASLEGNRLTVQSLMLAMGTGRVNLTGSLDLKTNRAGAHAILQNVDLSQAIGPPESPDAPRGIADGDLLLDGPLSDPDVQANLRVVHPRLGEVEGDSLVVAGSYAPGTLSLSNVRWVRGSGSATLAGTARPRMTLQEWMRALERKDHAWASRVDLSLLLDMKSFDLNTLAPIDTSLSSLRGIATGTVRVTGTAGAPALAMHVTASSVAYHGVESATAELVGNYAARRLTLEHLDFARDGATTHVEGSIPIDLSLYGGHATLRDSPVALKLRMVDADFSVAALFVPEFAASAGKLNVTADLSGTPGRPVVTGSLHLKDGILRVAGRDEVLEGLEVDASFDEHRVNVTRIAAQEGKKGRLTGTGWWQSAEKKRYGDFEFRLRATEFTATDRETYMFRFNGDFKVQDAVDPGGGETYRITSVTPATLLRGELTLDLSQPREDSVTLVPFLYDIAVDVPRNLWYRNLDTEVELQNGQLTLRNEGVRDLILGTLDVKGKFYMYSSEFRILQGTISFTSLDRIDPDIQIEAETIVRGLGTRTASQGTTTGESPIYMTLSGKASQLKVHLHDDGGDNEAYLWRILTIGQFSAVPTVSTTGISTDPTMIVSTTGAAPDATLPVRNYLFRGAERLLSDVGFIDTIDLQSGTASGGSTSGQTIGAIGLGRYVTPELYVKYSRDFSATAEQAQSFSAEYRMTRHLLLRGEQIRPGPGSQLSPAQKDKQQYNLDLKVRLEY